MDPMMRSDPAPAIETPSPIQDTGSSAPKARAGSADAAEAFYTELARDTALLDVMDRFTQMVETHAPEWEKSLAELTVRQQRYLESLG